jgi:tetratricopeptide (TPR) repeat protein
VPKYLHGFSAGNILGYFAWLAGQAALSLGFLYALITTGTTLFRWIGILLPPGRTLRMAAPALAGLGIVASLSLAIGLCGLIFTPVTLGCAFLLVITPAVKHVELPSLPRLRLLLEERVLAGGVAVISAIMLPLALVPQVFDDTLSYHLGAPAYYRALHKIAPAIDARYQFPLLEEHVFTFCSGALDPSMINLIVFGTLIAVTAGWIVRHWGRTAALLAIAGLLASGQTGFLLGHVKNDPAAVAFLILALAITSTRGAARNRGAQLAAGAAVGWAFAAKYTAVAPAAGLLLWHLLAGRAPARARMAHLALALAGGAAAALPFLARSWLATGNPIHWFVFPSLGWSMESSRVQTRFGCPGAYFDLTDPGSVFSALLSLGADQAPFVLLGVPLLAITPVAGAGRAGAMCLSGLAAWFILSPCLKYMFPALPLLNCLAAVALVSSPLWSRSLRPAGRLLAAAALTIGLIHAITEADFHANSAPAGLGLESRARFLDRNLTTIRRAAGRMEKIGQESPRIDHASPAGDAGRDRLLLIGDCRGSCFTGRRIVLSQYFMDFPLVLKLAREARNPGEIAKKYRQLGIRYVVLNYVTSEYLGSFTGSEFAFRPDELARYAAFWSDWAEPIPPWDKADMANGGFAFYRLRTAPRPGLRPAAFLPGTESMAAPWAGEDLPAQIGRLRAALRAAPGTGFFETRLGAALAETGDFREAESLLRRGMATGPEEAGIWAYLGTALAGQRRWTEAADAFNRAARLRPESAGFPRKRSECLRQAEKIRRAAGGKP